MWYWNQANFECLAEAAAALTGHELGHLAEYCRMRERGLRKEAFQQLQLFLDEARQWDANRSRQTCVLILEVDARLTGLHGLLTFPLTQQFVFPVLEGWLEDESDSQLAMRWLGLLRGEKELLERAIRLREDDVPVRKKLIDLWLRTADNATHHLGESVFLSDVAIVKHDLARAREILERAPDPQPLDYSRQEIVDYEALVADWEAYCVDKKGTFPDWCKEQGRPREWGAIYYYE